MTRKNIEVPRKPGALRLVRPGEDQASEMKSALERGALKRLAVETLDTAQIHLQNLRQLVDAMPSLKRLVLQEVRTVEEALDASFKAVAYDRNYTHDDEAPPRRGRFRLFDEMDDLLANDDLLGEGED